MNQSTLTASDDDIIPAINSRPFPLCGTALSFIESSHHLSVTYLPLSATAFATMAKHLNSAVAVLMAVACVLPSLAVAARNVAAGKQGFVVQGRVFCDTCRAGFETPVSTYTVGEGFPSMQAIIFLSTVTLMCCAGAKVRIECRSKATGAKTCNFEGTTDLTGTYNILVADEHEHEICESVLVSSPESRCKTPLQGRERARVFLSRNNGIASDTRYANSLGFQKDTPLSVCAELLKTYEQYEV
ncbi:hypothetical protein B296_00016951 [Ensete ventricosum]|uniref:Pollen-specific protein C13 n=1 Tax=Ensete ventricosum TaxID=4639 RepID=A0A427B347_ENSVE|nr:hypothetical protein B296_00016951 [Ensete ventricosum]